MKIAIILASDVGQAQGFMARQAMEKAIAAIPEDKLCSASDAGLIITIGQGDRGECGSQALWYRAGVAEAVRNASAVLTAARREAKPCVQPSAPASINGDRVKRIVAVTACPTGVAHTFMAAEAIEREAQRRGLWVKVETRGSVGAGNAITMDEVALADLVIIAADIEVDIAKFAGKPMYHTSTGLALKKTAQEFDNALAQAQVWYPDVKGLPETSKKERAGAYRHLLTGVSFMLPMVVAGGLCIALSFAFGINAFKQQGTLAAALMDIGGNSAFALMVPVLAGYIAFSLADRPGLTPGLIGGMLAVSTGAGFIGGIIAGFLAGYAAKLISLKLKLPASMEALKPILIIPLISSLVVGLAMIYLIGKPVAGMLEGLTHWLQTMGTANAVLLGAVLGGMMCADMGGPVNKAAYAFGVGLLSAHTYAPMAAIMAAGMIPPLALGLATLIARHKFDKAQREGGKAALVLGLCFITEGAIPFAARDPIRVLPCCIAGGALTGAISMAVGAQLMAPHGGLFVLLIPGAITPVLGYLLAIATGSVVAGLAYAVLKRPEETGVVEAA